MNGSKWRKFVLVFLVATPILITPSVVSTADVTGGGFILSAPARYNPISVSDPYVYITEAIEDLEYSAIDQAVAAHTQIRQQEIEEQRRIAAERAAREEAERQRIAAEQEAERQRLAKLWIAPLGSYTLSARFGQAGSYWSSGYHTGLDMSTGYGANVKAVHGGTVTFAGWDGPYGNKVEITHPDGSKTVYAHMSAINVGHQQVSTGQVIGFVGCTGNCYGTHLHLEVIIGGNQIDPIPWLGERGVWL